MSILLEGIIGRQMVNLKIFKNYFTITLKFKFRKVPSRKTIAGLAAVTPFKLAGNFWYLKMKRKINTNII